jgi:citrate lyase beta subunit
MESSSILPDAIILDLEDSIPENRKDDARAVLSEVLTKYLPLLADKTQIFVRMNSVDTDHFSKDVEVQWFEQFSKSIYISIG